MELKESLLSLDMIMFGGKGGVGKTTCAASSAIWAAENGRNTLVISTDPAHSLGDSLGLELPPGEPLSVPGIDNLTALEIDPKRDISQYKNLTNISPLEGMSMPGMGPLLDDLQDLTDTTPPGIDEAFGVFRNRT